MKHIIAIIAGAIALLALVGIAIAAAVETVFRGKAVLNDIE